MEISEQLLYTTFPIIGNKSAGTCFIFRFSSGKIGIITNKHVIEKEDFVSIKFTTDNGVKQIKINNPLSHFKFHQNEDVDLCIFSISELISYFQANGIKINYRSIQQELIPTKQQKDLLLAVEEIVMLGCPDGIFDDVNNLPIYRRGITASHVNKNFRGKQEFLVDMACFNGSSGSPVFILNQGTYADKKGITTSTVPRIYFLGVLYAGPQHYVNNNVSIPNNLGFVIKSERILEMEHLI